MHLHEMHFVCVNVFHVGAHIKIHRTCMWTIWCGVHIIIIQQTCNRKRVASFWIKKFIVIFCDFFVMSNHDYYLFEQKIFNASINLLQRSFAFEVEMMLVWKNEQIYKRRCMERTIAASLHAEPYAFIWRTWRICPPKMPKRERKSIGMSFSIWLRDARSQM